MSDEPDDPKSRGGFPVVGLALVLAPLLYLLGVGPAALLAEKTGVLTMGTVKAFYAPVIWLHDHTPLREPLERYLRLWGAH